MRAFIRLAAVFTLAAGLAGCFVSEQPLVASPMKLFADGAAFGYYMMDATTNQWPAAPNSSGSVKIADDAYMVTGGGLMANDSPLVFEALENGAYIVQETAQSPDQPPVYFYGVVKVDGDTVYDMGFFCSVPETQAVNPIFQPLADAGKIEAQEGACKFKDHDALVEAAKLLMASNPTAHEKYVFAAGGITP